MVVRKKFLRTRTKQKVLTLKKMNELNFIKFENFWSMKAILRNKIRHILQKIFSNYIYMINDLYPEY